MRHDSQETTKSRRPPGDWEDYAPPVIPLGEIGVPLTLTYDIPQETLVMSRGALMHLKSQRVRIQANRGIYRFRLIPVFNVEGWSVRISRSGHVDHAIKLLRWLRFDVSSCRSDRPIGQISLVPFVNGVLEADYRDFVSDRAKRVASGGTA